MHTAVSGSFALLTIDRDGVVVHAEGPESGVGATLTQQGIFASLPGKRAVDIWRGDSEFESWLARALAGEALRVVIPHENREYVGRFAPFRNREQAVIGVNLVITEPTDAELQRLRARHAASSRMLEQERSMFISGPVAVFKWRNEEGWPVEYVSPNIEQICGYAVSEFASGDIVYATLIHDEDIGRVTDEVVTYSAAGASEFAHEPYRLERRDGKEVWIADYTTILRDEAGTVTHYLGYIIDITDRQAVREALRRAKEELEQRVAERTSELVEAKEAAEAANGAKSEFLANMSHELRTPLNAILGYAQILKRNPSCDKRTLDGLDIIYQGGKHLLTLINDVLDLAKIEARKLELMPASFDFRSFLEGISEIIELRTHDRKLAFVRDVDDRLPRGVRADEKRLRQVLLNLLSNAVKFTDKGEVLFRVHCVSAPSEGAREPSRVAIRFEVTDTGVGIAKEQLVAVFQPFEQFGEASQRAEGTGLGLAISQRLVNAMGGAIVVTSELGRGSTFEFTIEVPVADIADSAEEAQTRAISGYRGERRRVLVVDDRPFNRLVITDVLRPLGFEVREAENGAQGVATAEEFRPHLILMDMVMPVMTGFEATERLRARPEFRDTKIIATSASVFGGDQRDSIIAGCDAFLPKPVDFRVLFDHLGELLDIEWKHTDPQARPTENQPPSIEPSTLVAPALDVIAELYDAAMLDRGDRVAAQLDKLVEEQPVCQPFAREVQRLLAGADTEATMVFLERFMNE